MKVLHKVIDNICSKMTLSLSTKLILPISLRNLDGIFRELATASNLSEYQIYCFPRLSGYKETISGHQKGCGY